MTQTLRSPQTSLVLTLKRSLRCLTVMIKVGQAAQVNPKRRSLKKIKSRKIKNKKLAERRPKRKSNQKREVKNQDHLLHHPHLLQITVLATNLKLQHSKQKFKI